MSLLLLAKDALEDLSHILHIVQYFLGNMDGLVHLQGKHDGITGAGIQLDDFFAELIFHVQNNPRKKGALIHIVNQDALNLGLQTREDESDEIVGERTLLFHLIDGHIDGIANRRVHIYDKSLFVVT